MKINMPSDWDTSQLIIDLFATLRDATERKLDRLPSFLNLDDTTRDDLRRLWTHLHAAAFLMMSFAIAESILGPKAWKNCSSLPQEEFSVLYCIRNAVVHEGGDLSKLHRQACTDGVRAFERQMSSELCWSRFPESETAWRIGEAKMMAPYYHLDGTHVTLTSASFDRIHMLMLALCDELHV